MRFCFSVANCRLFGDESDLHFWTVASHYIQSFAQARQLTVSAAEGQAQSEGVQPSPQSHLDICHDVLCETSYFQVSIIRENGESVYLCLVLSLRWAEKTDKFQPTLEKKNPPRSHPKDSRCPQARLCTNKHRRPVPYRPRCQYHLGQTVHSVTNDAVDLLSPTFLSL